jgi:hypothetical protein
MDHNLSKRIETDDKFEDYRWFTIGDHLPFADTTSVPSELKLFDP